MHRKISHKLESPQCIVSLVKAQKQTKLISGDRNQDHLNFRGGNSNTSECLCCIFVCWYYSFSQPGVQVVTRVCCLCENPSRRTLWSCVFFCISILQLKNKVKYFFDEGRELERSGGRREGRWREGEKEKKKKTVERKKERNFGSLLGFVIKLLQLPQPPGGDPAISPTQVCTPSSSLPEVCLPRGPPLLATSSTHSLPLWKR